MAEEANPELESFRKQWQEEVIARSKGPSSINRPDKTLGQPRREGEVVQPRPRRGPSDRIESVQKEERSLDGLEGEGYHDLEDKDIRRQLGQEGEGIHPSNDPKHEPTSALEHYEQAVERESQGKLGDSVKLYRKAFRLDSGVDRIYKNKHFPPSSFKSKPGNPNPPNEPFTLPNPAHHSLDGSPNTTIPKLIASFSSLSIPAAEPLIDQSTPPSCPFAKVPSEILIDILENTAVTDVASFARLSLVCKRLAYLIATEDQIWKQICLSFKHGFSGMHYSWACTISGETLLPKDNLPLEINSSSHEEPPSPSAPLDQASLTLSSLNFRLTPAYPTHKTMFRNRPRVRFNGCYISTVNYIRPGASTASQVSWNTPVHIVTYYRYLRFFRDGICVSLLTTAEPAEVVHHLRRENLHTHHNSSGSVLPSAVMRHALRGRWKLGDPHDEDKEGEVEIETEGVDAEKYVYRMELTLRNAGRSGPRNNKLVWRGFWSWNRLTDDWAEFGLRNDRAFFWSRVGSYGLGE